MCCCRIHEVKVVALAVGSAMSGGTGPSKSAILISRKGIAHHYGCHHLPALSVLSPPDWGWIEDPTSWPKIGSDAQQATGGNLARSATRRCTDCG